MKFRHLVRFTRSRYFTVDYDVYRMSMAYTKTWTGRWTMDYGPLHGHAINNFVTSRIEHTPYETSIFYSYNCVTQSITSWLPRHEISISTGHGVYSIYLQDMYHLGLALQRKTISSGLF